MPQDSIGVAIKGSTQDHLPIEDVSHDIVMMKDGSCAMIMQLSSVNFDLLSEREQQALVFAYGGILNSFNFPVQIVIHTSTKDITTYLDNLKRAEQQQINPLLRQKIVSYRAFVEEMVRKNDVLSKSFYIVVPFSALELGIKSSSVSVASGVLPFSKKTLTTKLPYPKDYIFDKARASLEPKREHVVRLFSRLGLEVKPLNTKELIAVFYKIYNEDSTFTARAVTNDYFAPVVTAPRKQ